MKKRATIVFLVAAIAFMYWQCKQTTTVVVVEGVALVRGDAEKVFGQCVEVVFYPDTDPDEKAVSRVYLKAYLTEMELPSDSIWSRFTLKVPSADASLLKGRRVVVILPRRSRFAEWLDWVIGFAKGE